MVAFLNAGLLLAALVWVDHRRAEDQARLDARLAALSVEIERVEIERAEIGRAGRARSPARAAAANPVAAGCDVPQIAEAVAAQLSDRLQELTWLPTIVEAPADLSEAIDVPPLDDDQLEASEEARELIDRGISEGYISGEQLDELEAVLEPLRGTWRLRELSNQLNGALHLGLVRTGRPDFTGLE